MKKETKKELLKRIHSGMRLVAKPPKRETPKTAYTRKTKHKRSLDKDSSFFMLLLSESR